jgi:hypothetical protein
MHFAYNMQHGSNLPSNQNFNFKQYSFGKQMLTRSSKKKKPVRVQFEKEEGSLTDSALDPRSFKYLETLKA